jgi:hypothetical protein
VCVAPSAASADGATGKNFSSELRGIDPPVEGLLARVLDGDDALEVTNGTGRTFVVTGYDDEPYLRFRADGAVEENRRSPTKYVNVDRYALAPIPSIADSEASPQWRRVAREGAFEWHDHRIHWMSKDVPPQVKDKTERTRVMGWSVPFVFDDGDRARATGTLFWDTAPPKPDGGNPGVGASDTESGISTSVLLGLAALAAALALGVVWRLRRRKAAA